MHMIFMEQLQDGVLLLKNLKNYGMRHKQRYPIVMDGFV